MNRYAAFAALSSHRPLPVNYTRNFNNHFILFGNFCVLYVYITASIPAQSFFEFHTKMHDNLKGRLAPAQLKPICESLTTKFVAELDRRWGEKGQKFQARNLMMAVY